VFSTKDYIPYCTYYKEELNKYVSTKNKEEEYKNESQKIREEVYKIAQPVTHTFVIRVKQ
jgi:hypothetical protein